MTPMKQHEKDRPELTDDDQKFVDRVRASYTWPEPSDAERAAFRARLEDRIQADARPWLAWKPAVLIAASLAVAALIVQQLPRQEEAVPAQVAEAPEAEALPASDSLTTVPSIEDTLLALSDLSDTDAGDESLPADYEAISSLFLEGV